MEINALILKVLDMLINSDGSLSVSHIVKELGITRRILFYNIEKLNSFLEHKGLSGLIVNNDWVQLHISDEIVCEKIFQTEEALEYYIFTPEERRMLIFLTIGLKQSVVTLSDMCQLLRVSKNTIVNDMFYVRHYAETSGIRIENNQTQGYYLDGDESMNRRALVDSYIHIENAVILGIINKHYFLELANIKTESNVFDALTQELEKCAELQELKLHYSSVQELAFYILMMICRDKKGYCYSGENLTWNSLEYDLAGKLIRNIHTVTVPDNEQTYLAILLLSIRKDKIGMTELKREVDFRQYANELIEQFEVFACVKFEDKNKLIRQLLLHICPMYYRILYNIRVSNRYAEDIRMQFPEYYRITAQVTKKVSMHYGFEVPDEEIAYICIYFVSSLTWQKVSSGDHRGSILVICGAGIGTSLFVKNQLTELIGSDYIIDTIGYQSLDDQEFNNYDLILSTVKLPILRPDTLYVNALLSKADKERILDWSFSNREISDNIRLDELMRLIEKHAAVKNRRELKYALKDFFQGRREQESDDSSQPSLLDTLNTSMIRICAKTLNDQSALKYACMPLISAGIVTADYPNRIFNIIERRGLYFEIVPGVLLVHADPDETIDRVGLSLALFPENAIFKKGSKEPIRAIFVLASPDNKAHFHVLRELFLCIQNPSFIQLLKICDFHEPSEVEDLIQDSLTN